MSHGYSVAQTARLVCALRWACGRLSEMLDGWAAQAGEAGGRQAAEAGEPHGAAAVRLADLSHRLDSHRGTLDGFQPDSELMAPWRQAAPADQGLVTALDEIAALEGPLDRIAVAEEVFVPELSDAYRQIGEHAAPHCDAALASAARALRHDLDRGDSSAGVAQPRGRGDCPRAVGRWRHSRLVPAAPRRLALEAPPPCIGGSRSELAALCTVCVRCAASSVVGRPAGANWQRWRPFWALVAASSGLGPASVGNWQRWRPCWALVAANFGSWWDCGWRWGKGRYRDRSNGAWGGGRWTGSPIPGVGVRGKGQGAS